MKHRIIYLLLALTLLAAGCGRPAAQEKTNWAVMLARDWKQPYGTWLAYESLPGYFPAARREPLARGFRYTSIDEGMRYHADSAGLLVMVGLNYFVSDAELQSLIAYAKAGNEVLILSSRLDTKLEQALHVDKQFTGEEEYPLTDTLEGRKNRHILRLLPNAATAYGYSGRALRSYFKLKEEKQADTAVTDSSSVSAYAADPDNSSMTPYGDELPELEAPQILGTNNLGADFIRFTVGDGHITLHAAPLVLSNYFLLQEGNRRYLDGIWHSFPANISHIYWNEYYKRTSEGSHFGILWEYPATRYALILAILTLLTYVLFGIKRRQRIIPILPPVENASVSFVETVGRLYFNKGNHANLAEKMVQHFLEWVRTSYFLDTNQLNEVFVQQLAARTGQTEGTTAALVQRIHEVRLGSVPVTPDYLYELHRLIQSFYQQTKR